MTLNSQAFALDVNESFLMRTMEKYRHTILHVIKRFRTLDVMIDEDDLLQEAFFGVRNAHHAWNDARAINMKFTTYLTWHVSRHFQGKFLGYDKIVDLIDRTTQRVVVSIPYSRYRKSGRRIAEAKNYATRIRSLLVCYDQPDENGKVQEPIPGDTTLFTHAIDIAEQNDDQVIDIYNAYGQLVVTIPLRTYERKQTLIQEKGFIAQPWSIYEPRPGFTPTTPPALPETPAPTPRPRPCIRRHACASTTTPQDYMVDIYSRRGDTLVRLHPTQYKENRHHFESQGCIIRYHDPALYPEQPPFLDIEDEQGTIKSIRQITSVA